MPRIPGPFGTYQWQEDQQIPMPPGYDSATLPGYEPRMFPSLAGFSPTYAPLGESLGRPLSYWDPGNYQFGGPPGTGGGFGTYITAEGQQRDAARGYGPQWRETTVGPEESFWGGLTRQPFTASILGALGAYSGWQTLAGALPGVTGALGAGAAATPATAGTAAWADLATRMGALGAEGAWSPYVSAGSAGTYAGSLGAEAGLGAGTGLGAATGAVTGPGAAKALSTAGSTITSAQQLLGGGGGAVPPNATDGAFSAGELGPEFGLRAPIPPGVVSPFPQATPVTEGRVGNIRQTLADISASGLSGASPFFLASLLGWDASSGVDPEQFVEQMRRKANV